MKPLEIKQKGDRFSLKIGGQEVHNITSAKLTFEVNELPRLDIQTIATDIEVDCELKDVNWELIEILAKKDENETN